ncbi:MAG: ATP-grasp domain-containing protein [Intrasporangium sp.]|uniref:ATP-grasp domain-containing protein n=1 Tax=Intrasporangium sp. TaxID=1925024 RepID=UPI002647CFE6|nr:ATP-grasp domain-containing protein [Intrasporangium sp.]MDN5794489.1 ATP-grasp domain-containing protein [Intrasporangium sp.]
MNIVMISPGYPPEMGYFTRALAQTGATVIGVGDQGGDSRPRAPRAGLTHYERVSLADEGSVLAALQGLARHVSFDRVECLWEPYMLLAARIREAFGVPGMTVEQTIPFRDKEVMKQVLDAAGIRTPRHAKARTVAEVWEAAERIGFPLVVKPIAGAGSADTYRVDSFDDLGHVLPAIRHVRRVSVEEFIEAEEFTYDTICAGGEVLVDNISWYRPRPLQGRSHEWITPVTLALRDTHQPSLLPGREMGAKVLSALGFQTGFTHMEWYLKSDGEAVFGEIGARAPGARSVDIMNYATDADFFLAWAQAVVHGQVRQQIERRYNAATLFKRAQGSGRITRIEGLESLLARYGPHVCVVDLLPIGAHRRDWRATLLSDGMVIVRHPDLDTTVEMCDRFGTDLQLYAE